MAKANGHCTRLNGKCGELRHVQADANKATAAPATVSALSEERKPDTGQRTQCIDVAEGFICGCQFTFWHPYFSPSLNRFSKLNLEENP